MEIGNLRLEGRLTVLRPKRPSDAEADYAWRIDPELAALDATSPLRMSLREYVRYFRDELEYPSPWSVRFAVDARDGTHIGNCMYYDINDQEHQAEVGIMIGDRRYWDRGYGSDALRALLRHIFTSTPLERVYLHTLDYNVRAQRAFRRVGFRDVGPVRRDGHNFLLMEVHLDEWLAQQEADTAGAHSPAGAQSTAGVTKAGPRPVDDLPGAAGARNPARGQAG